MQTTNWRAEIKATYLPSDLGRNSEERTPADLNGFQLWARWCYTVGCSKERWWALQTHQEASFGLDTRYQAFKPNFLRPHFVQRNFFFFFQSCAGDPPPPPLFYGKCLTEILPCIPEVTYKSHWARASSPTPFLLHACYLSSCYAHTGNCLRLTPFHPSKQLEDRPVRAEPQAAVPLKPQKCHRNSTLCSSSAAVQQYFDAKGVKEDKDLPLHCSPAPTSKHSGHLHR